METLRSRGVSEQVDALESLSESMYSRLTVMENEQHRRWPEFVWTLSYKDIMKNKQEKVSQPICLGGGMFEFVLRRRDKQGWRGFGIRKIPCANRLKRSLTSKLNVSLNGPILNCWAPVQSSLSIFDGQVTACLLDGNRSWFMDSCRMWDHFETFDGDQLEHGWDHFLQCVEGPTLNEVNGCSIVIQVATVTSHSPADDEPEDES